MTTQFLKPCPFCGGKPNDPKIYSENGGMDGHYIDWIISCSECGATLTYPADGFYGRTFDKTSDAIIAKWNRRDKE